MAFRETIEAILKVKDANRFKAGMDKAARSVRKLGRDEEAAAAQAELLERMEKRLERQSVELAAAMELVAHSVDQVGDQMTQMAAKTAVANTVMKKSGSNAIFLGKSWAFWKDRLSLTRSEILTTAITIGTYFSPAIVAMGSSFAYAAVGGGGVALGGLSTLLFGFGTLLTMFKPVVDNIKKVMKAQDQYTLAVEQYGAASIQASRASAHMFGVINTQGGKPVLDLVSNIRKLKTEWQTMTSPGRRSLLQTAAAGVGTMRFDQPTLATGANQMAASFKQAMLVAFKDLRSSDILQLFRDLAQTFDRAIGPAVKGTSNFMIVMARVIRATLPYVVRMAFAWQRVTANWRRSSRDQSKLDRFFKRAVANFKAWWGLAKSLWRVIKIIFSNSQSEGMKVVHTLTRLVNSFADWLDAISQNPSQIAAFWRNYNASVNEAVWALSHPVQAINKWLPRMMDAIATTLATHAPQAAVIFAKAFANAGAWAQFLTIAWALRKFGFFKYVGARVAAVFLTPFLSAVGAGFVAAIGGESMAGSLGQRFKTGSEVAGSNAGKFFGRAFILGMIVGLGELSIQLNKWVKQQSWYKPPGGKGSFWDQLLPTSLLGNKKTGPAIWNKDWWTAAGNPLLKLLGGGGQGGGGGSGGTVPFDQGAPFRRHKATGGVITSGMSLVGEAGPELAQVTPRGTMIRPLSGGSIPSNGMPSLPDLSDKMHITVYSTIQVEKRQIARAVSDSTAYDTARRGGRRPVG